MKAMVVNTHISTDDTPGDFPVAYVANACYSMEIEVHFQKIDNVNPTVDEMNSLITQLGIDVVIFPTMTGFTRVPLIRFVDGSLNVPVIVNQLQTTLNVRGIIGYGSNGSTAVFSEATLVRSGEKVMTNSRSYNLSSETAPAESIPLIVGGGTASLSTDVTAWRYTPDGNNYVYYSSQDSQYSFVHLMLQYVIDDGLLSQAAIDSIKPAPLILNIDHINDFGDSTTQGGFQYQPSRLRLVGELLRSQGGICYADIDANYVDGTDGTTTGELLEILVKYQDVFKYIATHDHDQYFTQAVAANAAIDQQQPKTLIDSIYQRFSTNIQSLGLTVSSDFGHCAQNRFGTNFFELAQPYIDYTCDPLNLTTKAGYGFRMMRAGASISNSESYPSLPINGTSDTPTTHWLKRTTSFRGIKLVSSKDGGSNNGAIVDLAKDFTAFHANILQLNTGIISYFHGTDFEDPKLNDSGLVSDGNAFARGLLSYQLGANYASACPNTVKFGADVKDYINPPNGSYLTL